MRDRIRSLWEWLTGSDAGIALLLFLLTSSVYFATITGVTSSNDGSHYALVRALVERGSFEISPYLSFTENQDYAYNGERHFSDRPPGTALLAAPLYALSTVSPLPVHQLPSKHDPDNPRMIYALAASALAASGSVALFFLTLRRYFGLSVVAVMIASIGLAFGTATWKYGSVLFSHAPAALLLWLALYLILSIEQVGKLVWPQALVLGIALGLAPLVEYTNVLLALILLAYLVLVFARLVPLMLASPDERCSYIAGFAGFIVGGLIPVAFLLFYNVMNFGGPFELSTFHVDTVRWPHNASLFAEFGTSPLVGIPAMLFFDGNNQGLFLLSPVAVLGIAGLPAMFRHSRRHGILLMATFVALLLVMASNATYNPLTNDSRYLTPFLGLWFVPVAFWIDRYYAGRATDRLSTLVLSLFLYGLLFLSIHNQFMHIAFSWNYDLDLANLRPMATPLDNIATVFGTVFRNAANLPVLWLLEGCGLGIGIVIAMLRNKKTD